MKKILGLTVAALLVMALVAGGTWAYFSDTETVTANTFTAGTLALSTNTATLHAAVSNLVPGMGEPGDARSGTVIMTKTGTLDGELDVAMNTITNTADPGGAEWLNFTADLGGELLVALYIDTDQGGSFSVGDFGLKSDSTIYAGAADVTGTSTSGTTTELTEAGHGTVAIGQILEMTSGDASGEARLITAFTVDTITVMDPFSTAIGVGTYTVTGLQWDILTNYTGESWNDVYNPGAITSPANFEMEWRVPTSVGNAIQGDAVSFSIDLVVEQGSAD